MKKLVTVAALQASYSEDMASNISKTEKLILEACKRGAQIIQPSELFQSIYFCTQQNAKWFESAYPANDHPCVLAMRKIAKRMGVVIPVSIFEKDEPHYYNSVVVVDANGEILGLYRKSHIPDGPGYQEKYYFRPGNTGFKIWKTQFSKIGVGICWDQWYPECARAMVLEGASLLFYPTAIGSEPYDANIDTHLQWQRVMQGHAISNAVPIIAANRVGLERNNGTEQKYYGHSFIADHRGEIVESFGETEEGVLVHTFDVEEIERYRSDWGFFRDRRPDLYAKNICTL